MGREGYILITILCPYLCCKFPRMGWYCLLPCQQVYNSGFVLSKNLQLPLYLATLTSSDICSITSINLGPEGLHEEGWGHHLHHRQQGDQGGGVSRGSNNNDVTFSLPADWWSSLTERAWSTL